MTFQLFDQDTVTLSNQIRSGEFSKLGIPPSIQFDRIDVSNMGDVAYVGLAKIILTWGPFLKRTKHATLIEHFMSWVMGRKGADVNGMTEEQMASIMTKMVDDKRVCTLTMLVRPSLNPHIQMPSPPSHSPQAVRGLTCSVLPYPRILTPFPFSITLLEEYVGILPGYYNSFTAYIENSQPFRKYLHEDGIKGALRSTNLKLKEWHSVVPHVCHISSFIPIFHLQL